VSSIDDDFSDLESLMDSSDSVPAVAAPVAPSNRKRQKVSSDLVSFRYRIKNFWKTSGLEMLLIILIFFVVRHVLFVGLKSPEPRLLVSTSVKMANGNFSFKYKDKQIHRSKNKVQLKTAYAHSINYPLALINLLTKGGRNTALIFSLIASLLTILLVYNIGTILVSSQTGLLSALILVIFPGYISATTGFFAFNIALFYFMASLLLFLKASRGKPVLNYIFAGFLAMAAIYAYSLSLIFLSFFVAIIIINKEYKLKTLFFLLGLLLCIATANLLSILLFDGSLLAGIKALFKELSLSTTTLKAGSPYINAGSFFREISSNRLILPFSIVSLIAIGYSLRFNREKLNIIPLSMFIISYLIIEFIPIKTTPYCTLKMSLPVLAILSPSIALLLGSFLGSLMDKNALRWFLATMAIISIPFLFIT